MKYLHFKEIDSTQTKLIDEMPLSEQTLVSAEFQREGRGRRDNKWLCLENSLSFSFNIKPTGQPTLLSLEIALLICKFYKKNFLRLKWPNDIYDNQKLKCGGILVNKVDEEYIVGVGLNLGSSTQTTDFNYSTIDIKQLKEKDYKITPRAILMFINSNRMSDESIIKEWSEYCFHLGADCKVVDENEEIDGKFEGIGSYGEALIRTSQDKIEKAYTGSLIL